MATRPQTSDGQGRLRDMTDAEIMDLPDDLVEQLTGLTIQYVRRSLGLPCHKNAIA